MFSSSAKHSRLNRQTTLGNDVASGRTSKINERKSRQDRNDIDYSGSHNSSPGQRHEQYYCFDAIMSPWSSC